MLVHLGTIHLVETIRKKDDLLDICCKVFSFKKLSGAAAIVNE